MKARVVTLIMLGRKGPHGFSFQVAALALAHTLNVSFRNRLKGSHHETGKLVRQELSEWSLVANNDPVPRIILLCPVEICLNWTPSWMTLPLKTSPV